MQWYWWSTEHFTLKFFLLLKYLCVCDSVDWRKWEWGDVGWKESWGERGATHTPSQGQGGATHPSTQGEGSTADTSAQCERVLETGIDTWEIRKVKLDKKGFIIMFISEFGRPRRQQHTAPERSCTHENQSVSRAGNVPLRDMCSTHKNHYLRQYLCLEQME